MQKRIYFYYLLCGGCVHKGGEKNYNRPGIYYIALSLFIIQAKPLKLNETDH